ncbi:MAG: glucosidase [Actinomycetota bacterium]|nr:glucosidase [Actinomycetota bacterium]
MAEAERARLREAADGVPWRKWGPYLSERAWGTVREDYSADGDAWRFFPHDHAQSRTYRWNEDGLAGISDDHQILCFALSFWNGKDAILKERIFGLSNPEGNHGEDPKEYWWYLDSTPTHSWMRWRYMYPQAPFPYSDLIKTNATRSKAEPEYELVDTGIFAENKYWEITTDFAKGGPEDLCIVVHVKNAGPEAATIDVVPTLWFRNTWSWQNDGQKPSITADGGGLLAEHHGLGSRRLTGEGEPQLLFCDNDTNFAKLWKGKNRTPYPKDGIADHIVGGKASVDPEMKGTKAAMRFTLTVGPGETEEIRLRLSDAETDLSDAFDRVVADRHSEADEFYAKLTPHDATEDEAMVMRQAFAGMLWSKQFYHYDIERWIKGDPTGPTPPPERLAGRNSHWQHLDNYDVISMPDKWEYPWYAAWDLAFHCVTLAHVDPEFAKGQLILMLREWYLHPNGQIPAYEWNFGDVNPPVHAWAALKIFHMDGSKDRLFLARVFQKLLLNFTWWVNKKDAEGNNIFEGGFLGLDNIGPIDRSAVLHGAHLEQSDGTSWMAMYALDLMEIAVVLAQKDPSYEDIASKFFEHFCYIAAGINSQGLTHGLWDDEDGFYYDLLHRDSGECIALKVRSMVGLITLFAVGVLEGEDMKKIPAFVDREAWFLNDKVELFSTIPHIEMTGGGDDRLLSIVDPQKLRRILQTMLDEDEFLSPYGIRALSKCHGDNPVHMDIGGIVTDVSYEPGESSSGMFGGNSNWRGPIWMPVNYMLIESIRTFYHYLGDDFTVEYPTGSGKQYTLKQVADDISNRLVGIFTRDASGRRAVLGSNEYFQKDAGWRDMIPFHEYFHGDTGAGIGATHQTGWTGLVADLIASGHGVSSAVAPHDGVKAPSKKRKAAAKPKTTRRPRASANE